MNILLIYPKFPDTFWSFNYAVSFIGKKAAFPPLSLLTVAAPLPQKWPKRLVDTNVECLSDTDLLWADMVFIGGMTVQRGSASLIIDRCREFQAGHPGKRAVLLLAADPVDPCSKTQADLRGRDLIHIRVSLPKNL